MIIFATFKIALRALRRNTLRTLLTMLGIIIGVGAVIAVVSIGSGAKAQVEAQIASMGQNVILILSGNVSRGGFRMGFGTAGTLTREDFEAIRKEIPDVSGISPEVWASAQIAVGNQNSSSQVRGVGVDYLDIRSWKLTSGANFTEADVRNGNKVALLGKTTAELLFGDEDPVGQIIRIKNAPFTVLGLLAQKGMSGQGSDQDDIVLVPYTSAMTRLTGQTTFRSFNAQASSAKLLPSVQNDIISLLRQRHRIGPDREDDFLVRTQQEISEMATATSKVMTWLLGSVAAVSLIVGGIGIMNIMLVSVTERTREIGIRMAVGARGRDILLQFLTEAVVLSLLGGCLGICVGLLSSKVLPRLLSSLGVTTLVSPTSIVVAFLFSAVIGIFFGFYPARKASQLDPIESLRYE
ncbi:MAG: FtsX-like permease family protein [Verrucomicrobia bacterium]|nr:FtsX-like permease family protein [Verrucomicrobiota bacterium]